MSRERVLVALSGGVDSVDPKLSLGGALSTELGGVVTPLGAIRRSGDSIPGLGFIGAEDVPAGLGSLSWSGADCMLSWTDSGGGNVTAKCEGEGYHRLAYGSGSRLIIHLDPDHLIPVPLTTQVQVQPRYQNILDNVAFADRSSTVQVYRALYVRNLTGGTVEDVIVTVGDTPAFGTVEVGSEYPTNTQDSDGVSTDLPTIILDETDSGGDLPAISWASSVTCGTMGADKHLSFWIRYTLPASSSGSLQQDEAFTIDVTYRRLT